MKRPASALVIARVARVNLMPAAEIQRRAREARVRRVLFAVLITIAVAAFACSAATLIAAQVVAQVAAQAVGAALVIMP